MDKDNEVIVIDAPAAFMEAKAMSEWKFKRSQARRIARANSPGGSR